MQTTPASSVDRSQAPVVHVYAVEGNLNWRLLDVAQSSLSEPTAKKESECSTRAC